MANALVTGAAGLVGSTACTLLASQGWDVIGVDDDTRGRLFDGGSVDLVYRALDEDERIRMFRTNVAVDVEVRGFALRLRDENWTPDLIVHTAGQPSHDYSALHPIKDFVLNAQATLLLLESMREHWPEATLVHCSTNKVYGDWCNRLEYGAAPTRYIPKSAKYFNGFDESIPLDGSAHSPFGVSKLYADVLVQEYGLYYGLKTAAFRCGCITGAAHQGVKLHGFLAYLVRCVKEDVPYTIIGYEGKQVRDNIHAADLINAFLAFYKDPRSGAVYNMGGGPNNSVSVLEAIDRAERMLHKKLEWSYDKTPRKGDHKWWVTDTSKFRRDYPDWNICISLDAIFEDLVR